MAKGRGQDVDEEEGNGRVKMETAPEVKRKLDRERIRTLEGMGTEVRRWRNGNRSRVEVATNAGVGIGRK